MRAFCAQSRFIPFSGPHCNFRLSGHGFFFKFCPLRFEPVANSLIKGMYLPWDLLESALSQKAMVGPKGGSLISFDNTPRYFNNTQFTELVRDGWIGTQGSATNQITAIIQASLERGRAVTLAVERKLKPGEADDLAYWEHCAQFSVSPFKPT